MIEYPICELTSNDKLAEVPSFTTPSLGVKSKLNTFLWSCYICWDT